MAPESVEPFLAALLGGFRFFPPAEIFQSLQCVISGQERQGRQSCGKRFKPCQSTVIHQYEAAADYDGGYGETADNQPAIEDTARTWTPWRMSHWRAQGWIQLTR